MTHFNKMQCISQITVLLKLGLRYGMQVCGTQIPARTGVVAESSAKAQCLCTCQDKAQENHGVPANAEECEGGKFEHACQTSFPEGTPSGMKTLWPCVGLSSRNQYHPTAQGTTLTPNTPPRGYEHTAAQTQSRSNKKCIERTTFP